MLAVAIAVLLVAPIAHANASSTPTRSGGWTVDRTSAASGEDPSEGTEDTDDPGDSDPTGTTSTSSTTSTVPTMDPSTPDTGPSAPTTSTTVPYLPPVPPELADDPRLPFLSDPEESGGFDVPIAQASFDPLSVGVLPERIAEVQTQIGEEAVRVLELSRELAALNDSVAALEARVDRMGRQTRISVRRAAEARKALRDHALLAYTQRRGDLELSLLEMTDVADIGIAKEYISVLMGRQVELSDEYEAAIRSLDRRGAELADELGVKNSKIAETRAAIETGMNRVKDLRKRLAVYELGAHIYVAGFVFPLASKAEFIDSWGYPRMVGTASEHWHQGTDIFAPYGAPAVAAENGVIQRLGQASLGGNKLWVRGDSGMSYYYAHLSAFAEGMENGRRVRAGEVVGYVGDTGNAKGTSPHLHFETHPAGGPVVNAYPLLRAAYGNGPTFRAVVAEPADTAEEPSGG